MLGMIHEFAERLAADSRRPARLFEDRGRATVLSKPSRSTCAISSTTPLACSRDARMKRGLRVRVDIAPEVAASLRGDSVRLAADSVQSAGQCDQVHDGRRSRRLRAVGRTDANGAQTLEMSVEDTGIGIAPDVQAQSFRAVRAGGIVDHAALRRHRSRPDDLPQAGALMGGALELESTLGVGTRMTVRLEMPVERHTTRSSGLRGKRGIVASRRRSRRRGATAFWRRAGDRPALRGAGRDSIAAIPPRWRTWTSFS